jgi:hypothetical protein
MRVLFSIFFSIYAWAIGEVFMPLGSAAFNNYTATIILGKGLSLPKAYSRVYNELFQLIIDPSAAHDI